MQRDSVYQPFFSDHLLTECKVTFLKNFYHRKTIKCRNYRAIDLDKLHGDPSLISLFMNERGGGASKMIMKKKSGGGMRKKGGVMRKGGGGGGKKMMMKSGGGGGGIATKTMVKGGGCGGGGKGAVVKGRTISAPGKRNG
jgi:hypothetical protein